MALGSTVGFWLGGGAGGAGGLVGGPLAVGTSAAGAMGGAAAGGAIGIAIGGAIDAGIHMFSRRSDAIDHAESLVDNIEGHLSSIGRNPRHPGVNSQATEIRAWLNDIQGKIRHMGRRTGRDWQQRVDQWWKRLDDLLDEGGD